MRIPDNYDYFLQHDKQLYKALKESPKCCLCDEHIQEDYCYEIDGEIVCEHCLNSNYRLTLT